jgi:hypothetical protein
MTNQKTYIAYANGIMTRYVYDTLSFRLLRLKSEEYSVSFNTYTSSSRTTKQDFDYEYDLTRINSIYMK